MADRHRLHISELEDFKEWFVKDGWDIEETKETWEVLRARKSGRKNPLIVYTKIDAKEHLSVMDRDSGVISAFLRDSKKPKTNGDRIRAMSDTELAVVLNTIFIQGSIETIQEQYPDSVFNRRESSLKWLQSESE